MFLKILLAIKFRVFWNFIGNKIFNKIFQYVIMTVIYMLFEIFIANKIPIANQHVELFIASEIRYKS